MSLQVRDLHAKQTGMGEASSPMPVPDALRRSTDIVKFARGRRIFEQGMSGNLAYLVESGKVKITRQTSNGYHHVLAILGPGDVFGELSLFESQPRSASAHAITHVTLRELDRTLVNVLLESDLEVSTWFIRQLARRLRRANDAVTDLAFSDVPTRVAQVLLDLADQFGREVDGTVFLDHGLTQLELAQLAGAARESVNKALASFVSRGWITAGKRTARILDTRALARRAGRSGRGPEPDLVAACPSVKPLWRTGAQHDK